MASLEAFRSIQKRCGIHAGAGAVDGGVRPSPELLAADATEVDPVADAPCHASQDATERIGRCGECGGVLGSIPEGLGTALKPAWEPIVVARKPLAGTVAGNVLAYGTGALNIDGCRVPHVDDADRAESEGKNRHAQFGTEPGGNNVYGDFSQTPVRDYDGSRGRWPTNVVLDESQAAELDRQTGILTSGKLDRSKITAVNGDGWRFNGERTGTYEQDSGGASRFFPTFRYEAKAPASERPKGEDGTAHPTVKPLELMRWLVRLVTPPGGVVLDPFLGSGTTAEACLLEGARCVGMEREVGYLRLIDARLAKPMQPSLFQ